MPSQEISVSDVKQGLRTRFIGRNILYFPRLPSTMDAARREVHNRAPEGTVIIAGEQTQGRGRLKRAWLAPEGNIALSLVLYPAVARLPYLIMISSLAAAQSVESVTGLAAQIKWPNDILIDDKKVAGILVENEVKGKNASAVIGVGINVALRTAKIDEISSIATSLEEQLGKTVSRKELIQKFLEEFEILYIMQDFKPVFKRWKGRLVTLGQKVAALWCNDVIEGVAESVDETGALLIRRADGALTRVVAGDVTLKK